jgi:hypothetical protein
MSESTSNADMPAFPGDLITVGGHIGSLISIASQRALLSLRKEVNATPSAQRQEVAASLATADSMRVKDLAIPEDLRLSMRWFEKTPGEARSALAATMPVIPVSDAAAAATIYASVGSPPVCASFGWGTYGENPTPEPNIPTEPPPSPSPMPWTPTTVPTQSPTIPPDLPTPPPSPAPTEEPSPTEAP